MPQLPFMKLFVADYITDTRILSLQSRAIWMDLLCLMHDGDRRGHLSRNGNPYSSEQIASFCGCSLDTVTLALQELITSGVCSVQDSGVIYSRRMVREETKRALCSEAGKRGGNPTFKGQNKGPPKVTFKGRSKGGPKGSPKGTLASSSSLFASEEKEGGAGEKREGLPDSLQTPDFLKAWDEWMLQKRQQKHTLTDLAIKKQLSFCAKIGPENAIAAINHSIMMNYTGIFEANGAYKNGHGQPTSTMGPSRIASPQATLDAIAAKTIRINCGATVEGQADTNGATKS